ncbi:MAG TPA: type II secretion system secretin GspD [Casimicrobiaceae bacterium]|nr:type II secretion system secretin GspD [Casimicrobiaceae bacterium]
MSVPRLLATILAGLLLALPARAADDAVTLNFVNADIDAVVKAVAEMTGRNFVVDPRVKGVVNIVSARPVPRSLVYPTLLSALRLQGFTAVETDGLTKIVPEADAKLQGAPVVPGGGAGGGDRLVTSVYVLKFESATQLVNVLRPLITPNNTIAALPTANALVITDYAENLKRIDKIIASLDVPAAGEPIIVPVRYASALDLMQVVNRLMTEGPAQGAVADPQQRVVIVADPRSNSVLIRGDNAPRVARVRALIEQLDTPGRTGGNIFIIFLKNAEAVRVAQTLRALLTGGSDTSAPSTPLPPASMTTASTGSNAPAGTSAPAAATALSGLSSQSGGSQSSAFSAGGVTIQADPANNALIVMAPEPLYNNIRAIVDKLDTRRAQVFVEALIVEVSADRSAEFGIQWQYLQGLNSNSTYVGGNQNFNTISSGSNIIGTSVNLGTAGPGLNLGIIRGSITIPGLGAITNLALLVRALQTDNTANILATPNLLMLDNEESRIIVGQNVPFITGQYAQTGTTATVTPFQTIERQDVGVTLRVKPQITEGGGVRMVVHEEVSSVVDTTNPAGIIINKRSLDSTVLIDDGQIIVLGGLIQDSQTGNTQKIPFLGDIPIAGALFRYDTRVKSKTNLMVFLRPTIVRNSAMGGAVSSDRYDYIIGEQKSIRTDPNMIPPVLPNLQDPRLPAVPLPSSPANPAPMLLPTPSLVPLPWLLPVVPQPTDRPSAEASQPQPAKP